METRTKGLSSDLQDSEHPGAETSVDDCCSSSRALLSALMFRPRVTTVQIAPMAPVMRGMMTRASAIVEATDMVKKWCSIWVMEGKLGVKPGIYGSTDEAPR